MLTSDQVLVKRKGKVLELLPVPAEAALELAGRYLEVTEDHLGRPRWEVEGAWSSVEVAARHRRLAEGILKLIQDRCTFEMAEGVDPPVLRQAVFERASAVRRALPDQGAFDRLAVITALAEERALAMGDLEEGLFADLKKNHLLRAFDPLQAKALVEGFDMAQAQAVLLRAQKVTAAILCDHPQGYRTFFRKLKFRQLLHTIHPLGERGYRVELDGPLSLFCSAAKYGLQLALMLPVLDECCSTWTMEATVGWGKARTPLTFRLRGPLTARPKGLARDSGALPDEVAALLDGFRRLDTAWDAEVSGDILELPGLGLCVPDLVFTHRERGERAYLEVMGYWSREAVWRRVELVQAGLPQRIIFAVSAKLRVSEAVLEDDLPGELYVYKRTMRARAIAERLGG